jgi:hypothetical protein
MVEGVIVAALMAAIVVAIAVVADAQPRVTAVVQATAVVDIRPRVTAVAEDVLLRATAAAVAIRRRAADPRTVAVGRRTVVDRRRAVAADMDGETLRWILSQRSKAA